MELQEPSESNPTILEPPGYVNPLESSSRWYLNVRANILRYAAGVGFSIANRTEPPAPSPTSEVWLDSTLSEYKGKKQIKVEIWKPTSPTTHIGAYPAIINFHGGGWILGQGTDDSRWAGAVMTSLDAVVFTVNYRLAPSYPFPTPIEDCVDAVCQITRRAAEFGIDPERIILSGFSAGATNTLATWLVLANPERFSYKLSFHPSKMAGLVLFYPGLDLTITRPEKRQTCSRPDLTLPKSLTDLIDASFIYPPIPREDRTDLRLSPGLMPDELLKKLPPIHLLLCEYDMLLAEGQRFSERLKAHHKTHTVRIVEGEKHAWDKPPPMYVKESVQAEYREATTAMAEWIGTKSDNSDKESMRSVRTKRLTFKRPAYLSLRAMTSR